MILKKWEINVAKNEKDELIPTCTIIGWRMCIDYQKLDITIKKNDFPISLH